MRRRVFLTALVGGVGGTAGCFGSTSSDSPARTSTSAGTPPANRTARTATPQTVTLDGGMWLRYVITMAEPPDDFDRDAPATVKFRKNGTELTIAGGMWYGDPSCDEIMVWELSQPAEHALRVEVAAQKRDNAPSECKLSLQYSLYELTISTAETSIERVVVEEKPAEGGWEQWTATPTT